MNDNAALNLIRNTFKSSFDRERFLIFAKNLFHFLDTDSFIYRGNLIPDAYDSHIKTLERLGKYEDVDGHKIEVLAVCLNKQSALERARTLQRNFIAWYLNGSRGGVTKDAALVAFYTKDSDDWRLSLVKMDYHLGKSKAGKIKAITELTPARRFSFLVGANENTHTAQRQLLPILKDTDFKPALSDLESAFSVEVVTKDFFEKYKKLFLDTKDALDAMVAKDDKIKSDFQEKNIDTTDFAKKLLGQIVFLYFLQKKGWFGVARDAVWGTGPKDFLRRLFEKAIAPYDNFFNDTLEPLFYEALAVERTDDFYSKFNCKIPFLNGGLFDPLGNYDWVHTDIRLPDDLFSNNRKTKEGDTGDGILDVFDRYNFTVKEDEPLEREVAVDPEMLGKVFENLLEVKDRKSKGTYYTPREIVHYMCQESLINYLLTELDNKVKRDDIETLIRLGETAIEHDKVVLEHGEEKGRYTFKLPQSIRDNATLLDEKLEKIHVCDPAVGSGAFLVGMMTEVIRVRNILTNYLSDNGRSIYDFKRHAIQNCLYGVDIDPGAVEIAKLRLWLSLIVDEQDIKQIKPLPNLDYKIMQGNSLLEEYEGIKLFDEGIVSASPLDNTKQIEEIKQKLSELQREFIKLHSAGELKGVKKQQIEAELKKYNDWLNKLTKAPKVKADNGSLFDQFSEAKQKSDELKKLHQEFFETANKREKDEIKKKIEVLEWDLIETTLREQNKLSLLPEIERFKKANIKPFFLWKLNFSEVFEKNGGFDVVIANPPWVFAREGDFEDSLKKHIVSKFLAGLVGSQTGRAKQSGKINLFAIFILQSLRVLKNSGFLTYIVPNTLLRATVYDSVRKLLLDNYKIILIADLSSGVFDNVTASTIILTLQNEKSDPNHKVKIVDDISKGEDTDTRKIQQDSFLKNISFTFNIYTNEKVGSLLSKIQNVSERLDTYFDILAGGIATGPGKKKYISDKPLNSSYKPLVEGKDIKQYKVDFKNKFILYDRKKLYRAREEYLFLSPEKLITQRVGGGKNPLIVAYDDKQFYTFNSTNSIFPKKDQTLSIKYLLALLNSRLLNWYYTIQFTNKSTLTVNISKTFLEQLPIRDPAPEIENEILRIVDGILTITSSTDYWVNGPKQIQVKEYTKQIDQLVYKLYGLTPEEIAVVEGKNENN